MRSRLIISIIITLIISSCIKEDISKCPDWGKYKVAFTDSTDRGNYEYNVLVVADNGQRKEKKTYTKNSQSYNFQTSSPLKLYPGTYDVSSIISRHNLSNDTIVEIQCGQPYYLSTKEILIKKAALNSYNLEFSLINSLITIRCLVDDLEQYQINSIEITPALTTNYCLDTKTIAYSQSISNSYDFCSYIKNDDLYYFYTTPIVKNNFIYFRITIKNTNTGAIKTLITREYLSSDLNPNEVLSYVFNVTPYDIELVRSTLSPWNDNPIITLPL